MRWTLDPFHRADVPEEQRTLEHFRAATAKIKGVVVTDDHLRHQLERLNSMEVYLNSTYQVHLDRSPEVPSTGFPPVIHLSIKRRDKEPVHDWRDLQAIKNMLVGPEHEAIELYPAESRMVDSANQYHLWVFVDPMVRLPVGWFPARPVYSEGHTGITKQRAFKE